MLEFVIWSARNVIWVRVQCMHASIEIGETYDLNKGCGCDDKENQLLCSLVTKVLIVKCKERLT